jgi:hypothetical protein
MANVLESTLEWHTGEVIGNSGIGSHTPRFSLDSALYVLKVPKFKCEIFMSWIFMIFFIMKSI